MRTVRFIATLAAMLLGLGATAASAATINLNSEMGFIGTYTPTGGSGLGDATGLSFPSPAGAIIIGSNDFAGQVGGTVTFNAFSFSDPLPISPLFTTSAGLSFTATSLTIDFQTDTALDFSATGVWSLAGFDDTPGSFAWTGDALGDLFSYSAAGAAVVPVPGALILFASGLGFLGLRRKAAA